jgi:hypothetical protein
MQLRRREVERQHALQAEGDVLGGEDVAVVEGDAAADLEHEGAAIVGHRPRLREVGPVIGGADDRAVIERSGLVTQQRVVEVVGHPAGRRVAADVRVDAGRLEVHPEIEDAGVALRARTREQQRGCQCEHATPDHRSCLLRVELSPALPTWWVDVARRTQGASTVQSA